MAEYIRYGFSGSDADAYAWFPNKSEALVHLETLHTISISVHEAKAQVRRLGQRGMAGLTRSVRSIAGSMIFVIVNDHPLRDLQTLSEINSAPFGWSLDKKTIGTGVTPGIENDVLKFTNKFGTLLPPFNLLLRHVTEYPVNLTLQGAIGDSAARLKVDAAAEMIIGIEFIDEGKVTSSNDIFTEITYSYVAKDYKPFASNMIAINQLDYETLNRLISESDTFNEDFINAQIKAIIGEGK